MPAPADESKSKSGSPWVVFATTHWSVVLAAGRDTSPAAREALEGLCRAYWYPLSGSGYDQLTVRGRSWGHPGVIEICVTSYEYDRSKLRAYATANVKECWLVLGLEEKIEIVSEPKDGSFRNTAIRGPGGVLQSRAIPLISVDLNALFQN
jgi:hypothetical protein